MNKVFRIILVMLAIFPFLTAFSVTEAMGQFLFFGHPLISKPAPDFTLSSIKGDRMTLSELNTDTAVILFFWATWCPHCRTQLPKLQAEAPLMEKQGIRLVLIDLEEEAGQVQSFLSRLKVDMDVFLDRDAVVAEDYHVVGVPSYFFVDKKGVIRGVEHDLPSNYTEILNIGPSAVAPQGER